MRIDLIAGMLILIMGFFGIVDGLRLIMQKDPQMLEDILGPSGYILGISFAMLITGITYLFKTQHHKKHYIEELTVIKDNKRQVLNMILVLAFYVFVINIVGYFFATTVFLFLIFRVVGFKHWLINIAVSITISTSLYIVFVFFLRMMFPRGLILYYLGI